MSRQPGQVAYEAAQGERLPGTFYAWDQLSAGECSCWARIEVAVLASANRLQVIRESWGDDVDITGTERPA